MKIRSYLHQITQRLGGAGIPEAEIEASLLLGHFLGCGRTGLLLAGDRKLPQPVRQRVEKSLGRRLRREPLAYILGEQEFWSRPFLVSAEVLIPRPETELLVETALAAARRDNLSRRGRLFDLGTGSGAIAVTLALELPGSSIVAIDRSHAALRIARRNSIRHGVENRVQLLQADWLSSLRPDPQASLIVSNPPYVAQEILETLQPEVRLYEPRLALDGGPLGTRCLDFLAGEAARFLVPGGWLFLEIGADQQQHVLEHFSRFGLYDQVAVLPDYAGLPRMLQARRRGV